MEDVNKVKEEPNIKKINFECDLCGNFFSRKGNLNKHKKNIHHLSNDKINLECKICGKYFSRIDNLNEHKKNVHQLSNFNCDKCNRGFSKESNLKIHKERCKVNGSKERKYECNLCGKSYLGRSGLCEHKKNTHNLYNYKCDLCNKGFSNERNLNFHNERVHMKNDKPGKCPICDKNYLHLSTHMRTHSGLNEFQCDLCPSSFKKSGDLHRHNNSTHLKKRLKCKTA